MIRYAWLALLVAGAAQAQTVSGRVITASGEPVPGASVQLVEASRAATTDSAGSWRFDRVASGTYHVSVRRVGYRPELRRVEAGLAGSTLDVVLTPAVLELAAVQVTATVGVTSTFTSPQPISVLGGEELAASQSPSLGETIERLPGLRSLSTGTGIGKPVIRGLTSNRVVVLADGLRMDYQQWGDEHSPNLETQTAGQIEVIRGPASVLYGSDALGGVVNVIARELPHATGSGWLTRGNAVASWSSNAGSPDIGLTADMARGQVSVRGAVSGRSGGDIRTATGRVPNTGNEALGAEGALAWRPRWGVVKASYAQRNERLEIAGDTATQAGFTGYQRIIDQRARGEVSVPLGRSRLEVLAGMERNRRSEYGAETDTSVATGLLATTMTVEARLHRASGGPLVSVYGLSAVRGEFGMFGTLPLLPPSRASNLGLFVMQRAELGRWELSAGARADWRTLEVDDEPRINVTASRHAYSAVTGNLGAVYRLAEPVVLVINVGRGFRAPAVAELYAHGEHQGTQQYEIGNPAIGTETSTNLDAAVRVRAGAIEAEGGVFVNSIHDYIYARPTGQRDSASGLAITRFEQGDARLAGFEASARLQVLSWLMLRGSADYVRGTNRSSGAPLPWMPPLRLGLSARADAGAAGPLRALRFTAGIETNARQSRPDAGEFVPGGYTLLESGAGFTLGVGGRSIGLDLVVKNLLDTPYASFMSRYKSYAANPGRNITIRLSTAL